MSSLELGKDRWSFIFGHSHSQIRWRKVQGNTHWTLACWMMRVKVRSSLLSPRNWSHVSSHLRPFSATSGLATACCCIIITFIDLLTVINYMTDRPTVHDQWMTEWMAASAECGTIFNLRCWWVEWSICQRNHEIRKRYAQHGLCLQLIWLAVSACISISNWLSTSNT